MNPPAMTAEQRRRHDLIVTLIRRNRRRVLLRHLRIRRCAR